jgi:hypothetical protein
MSVVVLPGSAALLAAAGRAIVRIRRGDFGWRGRGAAYVVYLCGGGPFETLALAWVGGSRG